MNNAIYRCIRDGWVSLLLRKALSSGLLNFIVPSHTAIPALVCLGFLNGKTNKQVMHCVGAHSIQLKERDNAYDT